MDLNTSSNRVICKRCLLKDFPEESYFKSLHDYINGLDEEIKVSQEEYERRLDLCKECENLISGMCRVCGCYVELRAAMIKHACPGQDKRW